MLVEIRTLRFGELSVECEANTKVSWLREEIARRLSVRSAEQIVLVCNGMAITDKAAVSSIGGSVLATVRPGQPGFSALHSQNQRGSQRAAEDDGSFQLPANASSTARRIAKYLQKNLNCPDLLLSFVFKVKAKMVVYLIVWLCGARLSSWLSLGPLYILATIVALIFLNLGQRREGEASAYSIFNNFRALPGQLTADQLDQQVRTGQMG